MQEPSAQTHLLPSIKDKTVSFLWCFKLFLDLGRLSCSPHKTSLYITLSAPPWWAHRWYPQSQHWTKFWGRGSIPALENLFREVDLTGCFYHFHPSRFAFLLLVVDQPGLLWHGKTNLVLRMAEWEERENLVSEDIVSHPPFPRLPAPDLSGHENQVGFIQALVAEDSSKHRVGIRLFLDLIRGNQYFWWDVNRWISPPSICTQD